MPNRLKYKVDQSSARGVVAVLSRVPTRLRNKIIREAYKEWGQGVIGAIRKNISWNSKNMKRAVKQVIKSYRRGKIMYSCVGVEDGGSRDNKSKPGWRAHMYDQGWTPYPKGKPTNRRGKGLGRAWRKGLRNQGGTKIYKTEFISKTAPMEIGMVAILEKRIQQMIQGGNF